MGLCRGSHEGIGKATAGGDDFVDFWHEGLGLGDGDEHALVVAEVIGGEGAATAVFEPLDALFLTSVCFCSKSSERLQSVRVIGPESLLKAQLTIFSDIGIPA